jgi:hypothetical protein
MLLQKNELLRQPGKFCRMHFFSFSEVHRQYHARHAHEPMHNLPWSRPGVHERPAEPLNVLLRSPPRAVRIHLASTKIRKKNSNQSSRRPAFRDLVPEVRRCATWPALCAEEVLLSPYNLLARMRKRADVSDSTQIQN